MANAIFFTVGGCVPTMADAERDELIRSLEELPVAAILTELSTHTFVAANDAAAVVFGSPAAKLRGTDVLERIEPHDREAAKAAYKALADKVVDGYHVVRRIVTPDGKVVGVDFWGRRVEGAGKLYGLWLLSPTLGSTTGLDVITLGSSPVVLAVTDHDWQIEYMSSDAHLLCSKGSELRGFPLRGERVPGGCLSNRNRPCRSHGVYPHSQRARPVGKPLLLDITVSQLHAPCYRHFRHIPHISGESTTDGGHVLDRALRGLDGSGCGKTKR